VILLKVLLVTSVLNENGGDLQRSIDTLLNLTSLSEESSKVDVTPSISTVSSFSTSTLSDADLARQLQEELSRESQHHYTDQSLAGIVDDDEQRFINDIALAQQLQEQLNTSPFPGTYRGNSNSKFRGNGAIVNHGGGGAFMENQIPQNVDIEKMVQTLIGEEGLEKISQEIKKNILPLIIQELQQFEFPPIEQDAETFSFGCEKIKLAEVNLPPENVTLTLEGNSINLKVTEISASLTKFAWRYKKTTFPKLKDDGHATAKLTGGTINVLLAIVPSLNNVSLNVTQSKVEIRKLDIKISGTKVSFVYNFLISVASDYIKRNIEETLSNMIRDTLNQASSDLLNLFQQ